MTWALQVGLTVGATRLDERLLRAERRARAWPPATLGAAALAFGALALPVHFARTRGVLRGVPAGIVAGALVVLLASLPGLALAAFTGEL